MHKFHFVILAGLAGSLAAGAGQIQIGGANGITTAYITNPNGNGCQGTCTAGSLGGWQERNYVTALFDATTPTNPTSNGSTSVPTVANVVPGSNSAITDNNNGGVKFNLLNDGIGTSISGNNGFANNIWASVNNAGTIVIPVGVSAVDKVWLMLNDYWGYIGANSTISFNFSSVSPNDASPNLLDSLVLTEGPNGPIRSTVDCTGVTGTGVTCGATTANGAVIGGAPITATPTGVGFGDAILYTSTIWSGDFQTTSSSFNGPYHTPTGDTTGKVVLDDTLFDFGTKYIGDYLVSISITSALPSATSQNLSRLALSAITVDSVPEPSTIALFGVGLSFMGFVRARRRAA